MVIENKVIVITGAARGLGSAISHYLAAKGAIVALIDIDHQLLTSAMELHHKQGHEAAAFVADVSDENSVVSAFAKIKSRFGRIDGLVNNAGIIKDRLLVKAKNGTILDSLSLEDWQKVIDVNLTGVFLCGREAAKYLIEQGSEGVIINLSSIARNGNIGQSNYSAAKAGVVALTTTWAKELAHHKIRSVAIAPGFIATDMTESIKPEILDKIRQGIPLKDFGLPIHIAQTVAFIFENDYISGRVIEIDGALRI